MNLERVKELLTIEKECITRNVNKECNRNCETCDLVQDDIELLEMYNNVIDLVSKEVVNG